MENMINKPRINKWIGGMYAFVTIFILVLLIGITFEVGILSNPVYLQAFFFGIMIFVLLLMGVSAYSFFNTKYIIQDGVLYSWSPFAIIKLELNDIKKVERTIVPFHIRVGASLYCGMFYIPSLGWTKSIITNMSDGVIITTKKNKHFLITPSNPGRFVRSLKK
jgi:hypothetical protein